MTPAPHPPGMTTERIEELRHCPRLLLDEQAEVFAEIDRLRLDAARLDWLENHCVDAGIRSMATPERTMDGEFVEIDLFTVSSETGATGYGEDVRTAIDNAVKRHAEHEAECAAEADDASDPFAAALPPESAR